MNPWELGRGRDPQKWIPAQVPGAVQLDWAAAQGWDDWWKGSNWKQYEGLEDHFWVYRTTLEPQPQPVALSIRGVDYECDIYFGADLIKSHEGMFTPIWIDLTGQLEAPKELRIVIHPAPKDPTAPAPRRESRRTTKPAVSYGWDFHPRLIPLGIWDEVELVPLFKGRIQDAEATYTLSEDLKTAHIRLLAETDAENVNWTVLDPGGEKVAHASGNQAELTLDNPSLWWPHDQGNPDLYTVLVKTESDEKNLRVGLRRTRLVMNEGAWNWPATFPKPRSRPPMTLEINGRRIFAKGSNWVPADIFPGRVERPQIESLLKQAKGANMNLLRHWGGGPIQKAFFYDLCDELGIMVWQEFPLACNLHPDAEEYLEVLDQDSRSIIKQLFRHPSLVMWCGGNELFNVWSGMTDQAHPLRLLNSNCYELDRHTPFLPTSPVDGVGHGGYTFRDPYTSEECWSQFQNSDYSAYCEFGCGGIANLEVLRSFLPPEEEFPPLPGTAWECHHAFKAWQGDTWLDLKTIEHYFGPSSSLEELVEKGQILQAEGFRGLFEEARRQKPACSMALNWCLNEPWPSAANNSLICWPDVPKPALKAVGEACRPTLASAKISRFLWKEGDWFDPEFWILNDAPEAIEAVKLVARIGQIELLQWEISGVEANQNLRGPRGGVHLPAWASDRFELTVEVVGHPEWQTTYLLAYRSHGAFMAGDAGINN